jgi:hypothetical protein
LGGVLAFTLACVCDDFLGFLNLGGVGKYDFGLYKGFFMEKKWPKS